MGKVVRFPDGRDGEILAGVEISVRKGHQSWQTIVMCEGMFGDAARDWLAESTADRKQRSHDERDKEHEMEEPGKAAGICCSDMWLTNKSPHDEL
jgi:hypothetical protein